MNDVAAMVTRNAQMTLFHMHESMGEASPLYDSTQYGAKRRHPHSIIWKRIGENQWNGYRRLKERYDHVLPLVSVLKRQCVHVDDVDRPWTFIFHTVQFRTDKIRNDRGFSRSHDARRCVDRQWEKLMRRLDLW